MLHNITTSPLFSTHDKGLDESKSESESNNLTLRLSLQALPPLVSISAKPHLWSKPLLAPKKPTWTLHLYRRWPLDRRWWEIVSLGDYHLTGGCNAIYCMDKARGEARWAEEGRKDGTGSCRPLTMATQTHANILPDPISHPHGFPDGMGHTVDATRSRSL
ncbi:hypothetical protein GALMADRAFT_1245970 [Galerina marginata CBS 339.88]|uniref:Uncharacterized protein n=1 Tax=Galerina marginata (strain CBS 339.88) TaxID=685588 RepID=A0A067T8T4_GALM3|nr:hypothetical protein GALMADRAFT_1245970 [Galerina marginata CBS 339.88]